MDSNFCNASSNGTAAGSAEWGEVLLDGFGTAATLGEIPTSVQSGVGP
jgi:hypothetical protein